MIEFINKEDSEWAYINIQTTMPSYNVQSAWVFNKDLDIVYSTSTIKQSNQEDFFLSKETVQRVLKNGYFNHFYLKVSEGILEIRCAPVQPSNDLEREEIPHGYLFVGRLWTENFLSDISLQTSAVVSLEKINKEKLVESASWKKDFKLAISMELPGWDGKPVMWLNSSRNLPMIENLSEFVNNQVLYSFVFSALLLLIVSISLFKVVNKPLKIISQSLKEKNPALLNSLVKSKAEFGILSSLIVQFFKISESSLQKLSSAIEQSSISVMITNISGEIEYVNSKFIQMNGYTVDEAKGQNLRSLKFGSDFEKVNKILLETMCSGMEWKGELLNEMENRELYWEYVLVSPIKDSNNEIINYLIIKEDITEKKKNEIELIAAKEKAEEANRLKTNFVANMSHELRTPMVGILGFANILSSELKEPEHIEMADTILKSGGRLTDTLNSILDLSRIESNKLDIKLIPVNLLEILDESVNLYKPVAYSKGLYLNYSFPPKPIYIKSDKEILIRVFNNLINNAIKFTHNGGVTIKIFSPKNNSDKYVAVDIIDTGIGIPKEFNEIIFEPFRQVSDGFSRKFEGSGLGLSITKKIVELLAGSISFESTSGKGSTFTVSFPLSKSNGEIQVTSNKPSYIIEPRLDKPSNQPSILLVEDNLVNASVIRAYLKDYASVDHFFDGSEGVDQCKVKLYDAVLMDINLKGIDGVEALSLIRQISVHYSKIPIIAITAYAMAGDKEKFLSLGFTHYLSKPFQPNQLLSLLSEILEGSLLIS